MRKLTSLLIIFLILLSSINLTFAEENGFKDIDSHWGKNEILKGKERGFIKGDGNGYFKPDDEVNYEMAIAILDRVFTINSIKYSQGINSVENKDLDFEDMIDKLGVDKTSYAYENLINILIGFYSSGTLESELPKGFYDDLNNLDFKKPMKREALFGLFHQLMMISSEDYSKIHKYNEVDYDETLQFVSTDYIQDKHIYTLIEQGLVRGNGNPTKNSDLKLDDYLTRAELTTMANRIYDYFKIPNSPKYKYVENVKEMIKDNDYTIEAPGSVTIDNDNAKYTFGVVVHDDIDNEAYVVIVKDKKGNYTELSKLLLWNTLDLFFEENIQYLYDEIINLAETLPNMKYKVGGRDTKFGMTAYEVGKRRVEIFYSEEWVNVDIYEENTGSEGFVKVSE